ncbi:RNA polymerase Rpb5, C-terminal domain-containing protein [Syncephalis fuscata]|nr:RNA polymerase Rpb5, C-terminal domain-containing protein [Syncephalis fuscata]
MDADQQEITRLWKVYRTIHQLCHDRGYLVSQADMEMDYEQFRTQFARNNVVDRSTMMFLVQKRDDPTEQLTVFFPDEKSVGIKTARKYCERMITQGIRRGVVIYIKTITSSAQKVFAASSRKVEVEMFQEAELLVNITHHQLVPKHVVLSVEEKQTLLQRYRLKETQLPRIQITDPVAKYYGLKRGQVVQIVRASETAGRYLTYRLCL